MPDAIARPPGAFVMPAWWNDPAFAVREIAEFVGAPTVTLEHWLNLARTAGKPMGTLRGGRRFFSAHETYVVTLLSKLRNSRVPVTAELIVAAYDFAHGEGKRRAPGYGEVWTVRSDVEIRVPAWLAWTEVRAMATREFGAAHDTAA